MTAAVSIKIYKYLLYEEYYTQLITHRYICTCIHIYIYTHIYMLRKHYTQ